MTRWDLLPLVAALAALAASAAFARPSARCFVETAYDSESEPFVLFGGSTGDDRDGGDVDAETWVLDPATGAWELRGPDPAPPPLIGANLVYDVRSDRVVLRSGHGPGFAHATELWSSYGDAWTRHEAADGTVPPGRFGGCRVYHPGVDRIVLFGGFSIPDDARLDDRWSLDLDAATSPRRTTTRCGASTWRGTRGRRPRRRARRRGPARTRSWSRSAIGALSRFAAAHAPG